MTDPQNPTQTPENTILIKQWKADMDAMQSCVNYWRQRFEEICASRPAPEAKRSEYEIAKEVVSKIARRVDNETDHTMLSLFAVIEVEIADAIRAERQAGKEPK